MAALAPRRTRRTGAHVSTSSDYQMIHCLDDCIVHGGGWRLTGRTADTAGWHASCQQFLRYEEPTKTCENVRAASSAQRCRKPTTTLFAR